MGLADRNAKRAMELTMTCGKAAAGCWVSLLRIRETAERKRIADVFMTFEILFVRTVIPISTLCQLPSLLLPPSETVVPTPDMRKTAVVRNQKSL